MQKNEENEIKTLQQAVDEYAYEMDSLHAEFAKKLSEIKKKIDQRKIATLKEKLNPTS